MPASSPAEIVEAIRSALAQLAIEASEANAEEVAFHIDVAIAAANDFLGSKMFRTTD